jgi:hypothetical protein
MIWVIIWVLKYVFILNFLWSFVNGYLAIQIFGWIDPNERFYMRELLRVLFCDQPQNDHIIVLEWIIIINRVGNMY